MIFKKRFSLYFLIGFGLNFVFALFFSFQSLAQNLPANLIVLEEFIRRSQLLNKNPSSSFLNRPIVLSDSVLFDSLSYSSKIISSTNEKFWRGQLSLLPLFSGTQVGTGNPYPEVSKFLVAKGMQQFISTGVYASFGPFSIQLQPEWITAQNKKYFTGLRKAYGIEYIENFGEGSYRKFNLGQSSLRVNFGAFSIGGSSENFWWGPGQ